MLGKCGGIRTESRFRELSGNPVVNMPTLSLLGPEFSPWLGTEILQAARYSRKERGRESKIREGGAVGPWLAGCPVS